MIWETIGVALRPLQVTVQTPDFPLPLLGFFAFLALIGLGLWIWSLIHCLLNKKLTDTNRLIGIVVISVLGIFGSLIYLFIPREE